MRPHLIPQWIRDRGLTTKVLLSTTLVLLAGVVLLVSHLASVARASTIEQSMAHARDGIEQYKTLRAYYNTNVVERLGKHSTIAATHDYRTREGGIPLGTTLIYELSEEFNRSQRDTQLKIYSAYPFPHRRHRELDSFAKEALEFFRTQPQDLFMRVEGADGAETVRVAVADRMVAQSCLDCHNSHAESPKKDWKLGDVRGVLEVSTSIGAVLQRQAGMARTTTLLVLAGGLTLLAVVCLIMHLAGRRLNKAVRVIEAVAEGDLTQRLEDGARDEVGLMTAALNRSLGVMNTTVHAIGENSQMLAGSSEELAAVSQQLGASSEETSAQANVVACAAEQVSRNAQTVSTSVEEMTASIKEIAKSANEAARVAAAAVRLAEATNGTVATLGESSVEIGKVVKVITSVAEQTNLLALNATIEAARAGEAGKGFAVVANEVKELAKETARATEDIGGRIEAIQRDARGAVEAIGQIGGVISQISDIQNTIASAVEEQTVTTNEIVRNIAEAASGSAEISRNIASVAKGAKGAAAGAGDVRQAAAELARMASNLQQLVAQFHSGQEADGVAPQRPQADREELSASLKQRGSVTTPGRQTVAMRGQW